MRKHFCGSFVFINQGYGILSSIYQNIDTPEPYPEIAKRRKDSAITEDHFEGTYDSIWIEPDEFIKDVILKISKDIDTNTYNLIWSNSAETLYTGLGMIRNGELVGTYW